MPLRLITTSLTNGQVSMPYSALLAATGGVTPYSWSVGSGALPTGLTLGVSNGQISGTPTTSASFPFTIQVKDSSSPAQMANQSFTVLINVATAGTPVTACGTLANSGTTYVLQNDISSTGTCLTLAASGITLDLNGHVITYNTAATSSSVYGITVSSTSGIQNFRITSSVPGGGVFQSAACKINLQTQGSAGKCGSGSAAPKNVYVGGYGEIDHLIVVDYGDDNEAIRVQGGGAINVHDNTVCPYHTKSVLNHYAVYGEIELTGVGGGPSIVNNNTIGTACTGVTGQPSGFGYTGIYLPDPQATSRLQITNNQISMASPVRDGYAIEFGCASGSNIGFEIANNTINQVSGRGILVAGWNSPSSPGCGLGTIHDNTVTVKEAGNPEGGTGDSIGIQARFGAHDIQIYNNTVTLNTGTGQCPQQQFTDTGSDCGGIGIKLSSNTTGGANLTAFNNTITATSNSATLVAAGVYGDFTADPNSYFKNNVISSNSIPITTDPPGSGSGFDGCGIGWTFQGNTITKLPNPQGYVTYGTVWYCNPIQTGGLSATNNVFIDNVYNGGAAPDDIGVSGSNTFSYYLKWSYSVRVTNSLGNPVSGASVSAVATGGGSETVSGITDVSGNASLILTQHFVSGTSSTSFSTTSFTPHNLTISKAGCTTLTYSQSIKATTSDSQILQGSGCS